MGFYPRVMQGSVTVYFAAPPALVWDLVSDVTRIGEFSPETFEARWLDGAAGPRVGARFRGHVRRNGRGPVYWTTCTVTASEPGREFAFAVNELPGTLPMRLYWSVAGRARLRTNLTGMRVTLEKMKAIVEGGAEAGA
jgi:uncharacterized protein YndB with AHSA1/START domain